MPSRLVVLVSGEGTVLQALLDACSDGSVPAEVVAVGADRDGITALKRAAAAGLPTFVRQVPDYASRGAWDQALTDACLSFRPDLVISAGFARLLGPAFLAAFGNRCVNTHPALLPSFPGLHAVRDALAYGAKVTGCTVFMVDEGVDTGPVIAQATVPVLDGDTEAVLHERIKAAERSVLTRTVAAMARDGWSVRGRSVRIGTGEGGRRPDRR